MNNSSDRTIIRWILRRWRLINLLLIALFCIILALEKLSIPHANILFLIPIFL